MSNVKIIDLPDFPPSSTKSCNPIPKHCAGCGRTDDLRWLFYRCVFICPSCKELPQYKTLTRTRACQMYGLTVDELIQGYKQGFLQHMWTVPNPYAKYE